jgi:hypothetical protein
MRKILYTLLLSVFFCVSVLYLRMCVVVFIGIYFRVRVFYNIILALLLKLASNGSLLVQTIYIVSGSIYYVGHAVNIKNARGSSRPLHPVILTARDPNACLSGGSCFRMTR